MKRKLEQIARNAVLDALADARAAHEEAVLREWRGIIKRRIETLKAPRNMDAITAENHRGRIAELEKILRWMKGHY